MLDALGRTPRTLEGSFCISGGNAVTLLLKTWGAQGDREDTLQAFTPCTPIVVGEHRRGTGLVTWLSWLLVELFPVFLPSPKLAELLHFSASWRGMVISTTITTSVLHGACEAEVNNADRMVTGW